MVMIVTAALVLLVNIKCRPSFWLPNGNFNQMMFRDCFLRNRWDNEKHIGILSEEVEVFFLLLGLFLLFNSSIANDSAGAGLVSYSGSEIHIARKLAFVVLCILVGVIEAILGFTKKESWRRLQVCPTVHLFSAHWSKGNDSDDNCSHVRCILNR